ncbi:RNA dependent RNA polymerase-domain-containing protein [Lasiosphaeria miniovina]|uniref:RNA-dependent RNA polymerase n=1 Tax=Lasiosphaeria miniovina TaxID=1954250 RepID=A0AA40B358_9PEZI|nr:RNA dependent RNA polymerase-domain-containing protein [Lasiosphaeria miniovina]KAK0726811.1 RNA dependent RNA polymerase-domain-containing protein [Lasiosphaeria miniovina]
MNIPDHCALNRNAIITPTRIYFNTPTVETTNRVVRHYSDYRDRFMRIQFTDEALEGRINGCMNGDLDNVVTCETILKWMGRFNHITVVAKYAARIGQCFSSTRRVSGIPKLVKIPLADTEREGRFTDGDEKLVPTSQWCNPPMNYTPPPPIEERNGPTADSLKAFFVLYMKNNNLPLIAHAHLATADYEDRGAKSEKCE